MLLTHGLIILQVLIKQKKGQQKEGSHFNYFVSVCTNCRIKNLDNAMDCSLDNCHTYHRGFTKAISILLVCFSMHKEIGHGTQSKRRLKRNTVGFLLSNVTYWCCYDLNSSSNFCIVVFNLLHLYFKAYFVLYLVQCWRVCSLKLGLCFYSNYITGSECCGTLTGKLTKDRFSCQWSPKLKHYWSILAIA